LKKISFFQNKDFLKGEYLFWKRPIEGFLVITLNFLKKFILLQKCSGGSTFKNF